MIKPRPTYLLAVALCAQPEAQTFFEAGFTAQQKGESDGAIAAYQRCLEIDPSCVTCRYELGWSYWKKNDFRSVVREWKTVLAQAEGALPAEITEKLKESLPVAESRAEGSKRPPAHPPLGTRSEPAASPVSLELVARFQSYDPKGDGYDLEVSSPKSAATHPRKPWVYIQSLEAKKTLVFDTRTRAKVGTVSHDFKAEQGSLFTGLSEPPGVRFPDSVEPETRNVFSGKPVEAAFSHGGRYLYVPYYRREYDAQGALPSAMAVIDTRKGTGGEIVRVLPTGPISKYVATAPNGKILAVSNWGDNTLHLLDISSKTAKGFRYLARLVVEKPLPLEGITGDRDHECGFCLRGMAFTPDSRYLFVARMSGGGVAVFDLKSPKRVKYLGSVFGIWPSPRDLLITRGGKWLYVSCNSTGHVAKIPVRGLLKRLRMDANAENQYRVRIDREKDADSLKIHDATVGLGARTMRLSKDERYLFVAVNLASRIAVVDTRSMQSVASIPADPYPVGLDITPDGKQLWLTSQGREGMGGNSVGVYRIRRRQAAKANP